MIIVAKKALIVNRLLSNAIHAKYWEFFHVKIALNTHNAGNIVL